MESVLFFGGVVVIALLIIFVLWLSNQKPKNKDTGIIRNLPRNGV